MEIRKRAELDVLYPEPQKGIRYDSPELLLMKLIADSDPAGAVALFPDRRLVSIRISDYAWMEKEIDWSQTGITEEEAGRINTVREFPAGVGRKRQETL